MPQQAGLFIFSMIQLDTATRTYVAFFRCKMLGPTLGFGIGAAVAGICYPIGCLIYLCAQPQVGEVAMV